MSVIDNLIETAALWGAHTLFPKAAPGRFKRAENHIQSRCKWFGGEDRKNGGTGRCPPDRRDHACHRLWSRLGTTNGHKLSSLRWNGSLSSRKPLRRS
jgi:hypothetical protein